MCSRFSPAIGFHTQQRWPTRTKGKAGKRSKLAGHPCMSNWQSLEQMVSKVKVFCLEGCFHYALLKVRSISVKIYTFLKFDIIWFLGQFFRPKETIKCIDKQMGVKESCYIFTWNKFILHYVTHIFELENKINVWYEHCFLTLQRWPLMPLSSCGTSCGRSEPCGRSSRSGVAWGGDGGFDSRFLLRKKLP